MISKKALIAIRRGQPRPRRRDSNYQREPGLERLLPYRHRSSDRDYVLDQPTFAVRTDGLIGQGGFAHRINPQNLKAPKGRQHKAWARQPQVKKPRPALEAPKGRQQTGSWTAAVAPS